MSSAQPLLQETDDQQQLEQNLFESVAALLPRIKERTNEARQLRKVPQASIDELQEAGFFLALQPRQFGGYEMAPQSFFRTAIKVSEACMSTASAGGRSVFPGSDIQDSFLDIHTARAHVANNSTPFARNLGALQLGMENTDFFV